MLTADQARALRDSYHPTEEQIFSSHLKSASDVIKRRASIGQSDAKVYVFYDFERNRALALSNRIACELREAGFDAEAIDDLFFDRFKVRIEW